MSYCLAKSRHGLLVLAMDRLEAMTAAIGPLEVLSSVQGERPLVHRLRRLRSRRDDVHPSVPPAVRGIAATVRVPVQPRHL
jgi:hypothetical protein